MIPGTADGGGPRSVGLKVRGIGADGGTAQGNAQNASDACRGHQAGRDGG